MTSPEIQAQQGTAEGALSGPRWVVYFPSDPEPLQAEALASTINHCDPDEDETFHFTRLGPRESDEHPTIYYEGRLGTFELDLALHRVPSPATEVLDETRLEEESLAPLRGHQAFAVLRLNGGEDYPAVEGPIFLLKVILALFTQGAVGAANLDTGQVFPAAPLLQLMQEPPSADGQAVLTVWSRLRNEGEPRPLLADYLLVPRNELPRESSHFSEGDQSGFLLVSRGFAHCGFAEVAVPVQSREDGETMAGVLDAFLSYQLDRGSVVAPGHSFSWGGEESLRLQAAPENLHLPFSAPSVLLAQREPVVKKKGLFRLFGLFGGSQ